MFEKVKVLLSAVPTYGAVVVAALTAVGTEVVPQLPVAVQAKVLAGIAVVVGFVGTVVAVVSRVKPIVDEAEKGLVVATEEVKDFWGDAS